MYNGEWQNSGVGSNPTLTNCTFSGNVSATSGGGMFNTRMSRPLLTACTLVGNSPGAMDAIDGSAPILVNSVIVGNDKGGIFVINASATLINCTVAGNSLGGVSAESGSKLTLTNCILWGNVDGADRGESVQVFVGPRSTADINFSVVQGLSTLGGEGNLANDPLFVREMSPGPDGMVGTDDDDHGDLRLRSGSLAIDAGDSTATIPSRSSGGRPPTALPTFDLDGQARFVDDPATPDTGAGEAPIIDMGAYEFVPLSAAPPELVRIMNGLGSAADTFISPLGEDCALSSFTLEATEPLTLNSAVATYTGPGTVPSATLMDDGDGQHTVMLDPAPEPGQWLKLDLDVTGAGGGTAVFTVWVAHQPLDVTQDGQTNIQDATAFGDAFRGDKERRLIDINCDGQVNVQDATAFGGQWAQWSNTALPAKP